MSQHCNVEVGSLSIRGKHLQLICAAGCVLSRCPLALLPCCLNALLPCCLIALLPCCLIALLPFAFCLIALLPCCLAALLPRCLSVPCARVPMPERRMLYAMCLSAMCQSASARVPYAICPAYYALPCHTYAAPYYRAKPSHTLCHSAKCQSAMRPLSECLVPERQCQSAVCHMPCSLRPAVPYLCLAILPCQATPYSVP
jgi:hypothetical protein